LVHPTFHVYGGAELAIIELIKYLKKNNHDIDILTNAVNFRIRRELRGLCNIQLTFGADLFRKMANYVHSHYNEYDVINLHNHPSELTLYPYKYQSVWYMNEPPQEALDNNKLNKNEIMAINSSITKIATNSEFNQEWIKKLYNRDSTVVRYGINYMFWRNGNSNNPIVKGYGIEDTDFVILHSGWWNQFKGHLDTIQAFNKAKKIIPSAKLILLGYNLTPYSQVVWKSIQLSPYNNDIIVTGMLDRNLVRDFYARADILVHPIRKQGGFISVYEALCQAKNIIVTKELPDISFVKKNNLCLIGDIFIQLLEYYNGNRNPNYKGRDFVRNNLTWNNYGKGMLSLFSEVI